MCHSSIPALILAYIQSAYLKSFKIYNVQNVIDTAGLISFYINANFSFLTDCGVSFIHVKQIII